MATKKPKAFKRIEAAPRRFGRRNHARILEQAKAGHMPPKPDFRAETHKYWRARLDEVAELAKKGDAAALKKCEIPDYSSSPRAINRFKDLCLVALQARAQKRA
jgi:hypothetical protein